MSGENNRKIVSIRFEGTQEEFARFMQNIQSLVESDDSSSDIIDSTNPMEIEEIVREMRTPRTL